MRDSGKVPQRVTFVTGHRRIETIWTSSRAILASRGRASDVDLGFSWHSQFHQTAATQASCARPRSKCAASTSPRARRGQHDPASPALRRSASRYPRHHRRSSNWGAWLRATSGKKGPGLTAVNRKPIINRQLDEGLEETFPASDSVAVTAPGGPSDPRDEMFGLI
jgi:hypothetical protein